MSKFLDDVGAEYFANKVVDLVASGGSADYIVEQGTDGAWYYRKWASGIAECWAINYDLGSCAMTNSYNYGYFEAREHYSFPTNLFSSTPSCTVTPHGSQGLLSVHVHARSATEYSFYIFNTKSETITVHIDVYAKGFWKTFSPGATSNSTHVQADYVIASYLASDATGGYTQWNSGKLEEWRRITTSVNITSSYNGLYYGSLEGYDYRPHPTAPIFISYPVVNITVQAHGGMGIVAPNYDNYTVTNTGTIYIYNAASSSNTSVTVNIYAVGKWK